MIKLLKLLGYYLVFAALMGLLAVSIRAGIAEPVYWIVSLCIVCVAAAWLAAREG